MSLSPSIRQIQFPLLDTTKTHISAKQKIQFSDHLARTPNITEEVCFLFPWSPPTGNIMQYDHIKYQFWKEQYQTSSLLQGKTVRQYITLLALFLKSMATQQSTCKELFHQSPLRGGKQCILSVERWPPFPDHYKLFLITLRVTLEEKN